jgi:hypothetical protein
MAWRDWTGKGSCFSPPRERKARRAGPDWAAKPSKSIDYFATNAAQICAIGSVGHGNRSVRGFIYLGGFFVIKNSPKYMNPLNVGLPSPSAQLPGPRTMYRKGKTETGVWNRAAVVEGQAQSCACDFQGYRPFWREKYACQQPPAKCPGELRSNEARHIGGSNPGERVGQRARDGDCRVRKTG